MTMIEVGTYGAKRQSQKTANPREILRKIMDKHSDERTCYSLFVEKSIPPNTPSRAHDLLEAIIEYWFANNYRSLRNEQVRYTPEARQKQEVKKQETAVAVAKAVEVIKARATMSIMKMSAPDGRAVEELSREDCVKFAKFDGLYTKLAATLKPKQIVGKTLSENEVRKLLGR